MNFLTKLRVIAIGYHIWSIFDLGTSFDKAWYDIAVSYGKSDHSSL